MSMTDIDRIYRELLQYPALHVILYLEYLAQKDEDAFNRFAAKYADILGCVNCKAIGSHGKEIIKTIREAHQPPQKKEKE